MPTAVPSPNLLPRIAITMGDPAGIGPEICLRLLAEHSLNERCAPIVFGDADVLHRVGERLRLPVPECIVSKGEWPTAVCAISQPCIYDLAEVEADAFEPGAVNIATGRASLAYIERSIDAAMAGEVDAVVTGPINKAAIHSAGAAFVGHTELFAARTNSDSYCMMLTCSEITCSFVTTHVGYRDVPALLSCERILEVIELSHDALIRMHGRPGKLVVCALNPHGGEGGLFGDREEERYIVPALEAAKLRGMDVIGPLPPDTAFLPERRREADCFVCMYHDQGHIPLKALAFDVAVNTTLGLPVVRTSVDHGTALDIAWQGKAEPTSLQQAVDLAIRLTSVPSPSGR